MTATIEAIKSQLQVLAPEKLEIEDESALHAGHAGNTGGGHYNVLIVSDVFAGLSLIKRHRLVYDAVSTLMQNQIHALSIKALTAEEFNHE